MSVSLSECAALDDCIGQEITSYTTPGFQRFIVHGVVFTTSANASQTKRHDCAFEIDDRFYIIEKCIIGKLFCHCDCECFCQEESFVICTTLKPTTQRKYNNPYTNTDLASKWVKVKKEGTIAFRTNKIEKKVVLLKIMEHLYVLSLPQFEMD